MFYSVLKTKISPTSYFDATQFVLAWGRSGESRYVCVANVHMLMEVWDSPLFREVVDNADLVTPDGMPLVWMLRLKGKKDQGRVYGPTLMLHILEAAARENIPVGFYGGDVQTLEILIKWMQTQYPGLNVAFSCSPPYRDLSPAEEEEIVLRIEESGTRILLVALGCPKQEIWMAAHRDRLQTVMLGVGAAFDFHAGRIKQSPAWMQSLGLEWLFRFLQEPKRLWRRYLFHNPRFIILAILDLLGALDLARKEKNV